VHFAYRKIALGKGGGGEGGEPAPAAGEPYMAGGGSDTPWSKIPKPCRRKNSRKETSLKNGDANKVAKQCKDEDFQMLALQLSGSGHCGQK